MLGALTVSVLVPEVLTWPRHVDPKPVISPAILTPARRSFDDYAVGDCARRARRHTGARTAAVRGQLPGCAANSGPLLELLCSSCCPEERAFSLSRVLMLFCASQNPSGEEGINSRSVPLLAGVCS